MKNLVPMQYAYVLNGILLYMNITKSVNRINVNSQTMEKRSPPGSTTF